MFVSRVERGFIFALVTGPRDVYFFPRAKPRVEKGFYFCPGHHWPAGCLFFPRAKPRGKTDPPAGKKSPLFSPRGEITIYLCFSAHKKFLKILLGTGLSMEAVCIAIFIHTLTHVSLRKSARLISPYQVL